MSEEENINISLNKEKEKEHVQPPNRYQIVFYNDDFTPFEFVVQLLTELFSYSSSQSEQIARTVHESGKGVVKSNLTKDIAETKVNEVQYVATKYEHPLMAQAEKQQDA